MQKKLDRKKKLEEQQAAAARRVKEKEEREKEKSEEQRRRLLLKMQEEAELKIQEFFKSELDNLDMNIMDDEKESDDEDVNKCTNAKDLFKSSKTSTKSETLNEELSSVKIEKNVRDQRTSYGTDVFSFQCIFREKY